MRITIAALLGIIVAVAVLIAGLRAPSLLWTQIAATLALSVLLVSVVAACCARDRAFWLGTAIFGWGYLVFSQVPWFEEKTRPLLLTTRLLDEFYIRRQVAGRAMLPAQPPPTPNLGPAWQHDNTPDYVVTQQVGHWFACTIHAAFGGLVGQFFDRAETAVASDELKRAIPENPDRWT